MKIGILGCFYDCAEDLESVLLPWREYKSQSTKHSVLMACVNSQFKEYGDLGYENENQETIEKIVKNDTIDQYYVSPVPLMEHEARNLPLGYLLQNDVDAFWLLDGDEFYTYGDINNIINFVEENADYDYYEINFKNYILDGKSWTDGFCPSRIFWTKKNGGVKGFYWDNDIIYGENTPHKNLSRLEIPRNIAHVRHMTWLHTNGKKKVEYHSKHFGECSYKWNEEKEQLEIDKDYYKKHNKEMPKIIAET